MNGTHPKSEIQTLKIERQHRYLKFTSNFEWTANGRIENIAKVNGCVHFGNTDGLVENLLNSGFIML